MNTTKSERIKVRLRKSSQTRESVKASTICYGYKVISKDKLIVYPTEVIIVSHIFGRFAGGDSLGEITASLARMKMKSPTGKELWMQEIISKILSSEKYVGDVVLGETQVQNGMQIRMVDYTSQVVIDGYHEATIFRELFDIVQQGKVHRSRLKSHSRAV